MVNICTSQKQLCKSQINLIWEGDTYRFGQFYDTLQLKLGLRTEESAKLYGYLCKNRQKRSMKTGG